MIKEIKTLKEFDNLDPKPLALYAVVQHINSPAKLIGFVDVSTSMRFEAERLISIKNSGTVITTDTDMGRVTQVLVEY